MKLTSKPLGQAIVALLAAGLLLAGCTNDAAPGASPAAPGGTTDTAAASTSDFKPVGACSADRTPPAAGATIETGPAITVAWVPKLLGLSVFEANNKGATQAGADLGITVNYTASVEANGADQAQIIDGLVNSNNPPDVIAYSANDPTTIVPSLEAATAKGILVIGMDSDVTASARLFFIQNTSYPAMGKSFVDAAVQKYGDSGTIGILSTIPEATIQNEWIKAITDYGKATYPNIKFTDPVYGESNAAKSQTETVNLMNQYPDMLAVFALDSSAVPGSLAAIKAQGKGGKIGVWGVSTPNANKQYFQDGSLDGLWLWDEVKEGELMAYLARGVCDNKIPQSGDFTAGSLGTFTVTDDPAPHTIIFSEPLLIDKNNYTNYDF